jgi:glycosyltransferase involved in cell wall biosynthesis
MSPLISILIPAKGDLDFFSETLKSIDESTCEDFEVLIIDDGISNYALDLIEKKICGRMNFRIVKNQGSGIVKAINTGIKESTGEYIARIDSDDRLVPTRLQTQADFLFENPLVGVVGTQITYIDQFGKSLGTSRYPVKNLTLTGRDFRYCPIAHPSVMIRRETLNEVGNYQSFLKYKGRDYAEDYFLWTRIARIAQIRNLAAPLTLYRQHPKQVSASNLFVTSFAADLVYLKICDSENKIALPVDLDLVSAQLMRQFATLGIHKIGLLFGIHLYSQFLLTRKLPKLVRNLLILLSRLTAPAF